MIAKKPLNPFSESNGSSSFEISEKSMSDDFEVELKNFINENKTGYLERMKHIPALGIIFGILSVFFQLGMFTNVKILYNTTHVTAFEMIYVRGIFDLIITFII